ncbi:MAG: hypothetical protein R3B06_25395 [Kofleriaceae bacterium]
MRASVLMGPLGYAVLLAVAGCAFTPSGAGPADDAGLVDDAGGDGGACGPGCAGDQLCVDGHVTTCALGCAPAPAPHCLDDAPSNQVGVGAARAATAGITADAGRYLVANTDDGSIVSTQLGGVPGTPVTIRGAGPGVVDGIEFRVQAQVGTDVALGIWSATTLTIAAGAELEFRGAGAAVVVSAGAVIVDGLIDVSGGQDVAGTFCRACGGVGGGRGGDAAGPATGCAPGGPGDYRTGAAFWETGGAGGGMSTPGAAGGPGQGTTAGAPAAIASCAGAPLEPLAGGGGGGRGAGNGTSGMFPGGGGGGALQLVSLTALTVGPGGEIYAGGIGGAGAPGNWGGGGGGAGGAILLEAPAVEVMAGGALIATGGGGGAGRADRAGQVGQRTGTRAAGGSPDILGVCGGGQGGLDVDGAALTAPTAGEGGDDGTGGGGGAAGRIRVNVRAPLAATGAVLFPTPTTGTFAVR